MIDPEQLRGTKDIPKSLDWDMTPQQAFEAYQIKTAEGMKHRNLQDVHYFLISVWKGVPEVLLVKRTMKDSDEIARLPVPEDLVAACLADQAGDPPAPGQYAVDEPIKEWLKQYLRW